MNEPLKAKKHCQGVNICLVGANQFQNELFAANLKEIHGCQSTFVVASSLSDIPSPLWNDSKKRVLVYIDCFEKAYDELEAKLKLASQALTADCRLALYNLDESADFEKTALAYGVRGFFYPTDTPNDFCCGTRGILDGQVWLSRQKTSNLLLAEQGVASRHQTESTGAILSAREKEILAILATGVSNKTIATELFISIHTVRTHLYNIYRKIKVKNRMQASLWFQNNLQKIRSKL